MDKVAGVVNLRAKLREIQFWIYQVALLLLSSQVVSKSLRPHGLQPVIRWSCGSRVWRKDWKILTGIVYLHLHKNFMDILHSLGWVDS